MRMDNLARDSSMAIAAGMSYGKWKALHPHTAEIVPEKPKATKKKKSKPVRLCRWCGKEIPETANAHRRYCCAGCAYEGKLSAANERYREKKRRENPENIVKP